MSLLISMVWSDAFTQFDQQLETYTRNTWILMLAGQMKIDCASISYLKNIKFAQGGAYLPYLGLVFSR